MSRHSHPAYESVPHRKATGARMRWRYALTSTDFLCSRESDGALGRNIFIFGCARSGTTLLLNLMRCFANTCVVDGEHPLSSFAQREGDPRTVVIKRHHSSAKTIVGDIRTPAAGEPWVIDIVRDPRDVVTSVIKGIDGYYCGFWRWRRDVVAAERLRVGYVHFLRLSYEELVTQPASVQVRISTTIGLTPSSKFEEYPLTVNESLAVPSVEALNGLRPLDAESIGRWRLSEHTPRVLDQSTRYPEIVGHLIRLGYEPDDTWLRELTRGARRGRQSRPP